MAPWVDYEYRSITLAYLWSSSLFMQGLIALPGIGLTHASYNTDSTVLSIQPALAATRSKVKQPVTFPYQGDAIAGARQIG